MKRLSVIAAFVLSVCVIINGGIAGVFAKSPAYSSLQEEVFLVSEGIIARKKEEVHAQPNGYAMNEEFLRLASTSSGDWLPFGLGRLNIQDNQWGYLGAVRGNVQKRYSTDEKLDAIKATEWHRISLAILASGGNPRAVGEDSDGDGRGDIDLIADGTYNRVSNGSGILGRQGINGFIWGLLTLDSMFYEIPADAFYSREEIILNILTRQKADGGWNLRDSESASEVDITAMAIQSLAPYYNSEQEYTYVNRNIHTDGSKLTKKVRTAVDEALLWLSEQQGEDGDFSSWGVSNCESTVQAAVALCSLGVDIFSDSRFIKNGNTLYDGLMKFRLQNGGFTHSLRYDSQNPEAPPVASSLNANDQALYATAAILRNLNGQRRLYDLRTEQSSELKESIHSVEEKIAALSAESEAQEVRAVYGEYMNINGAERNYVRNYKDLSVLLAAKGIPYEQEEIPYNSGDAGVVESLTEFTQADRDAVDSLPNDLTTKEYSEVLRLYTKIRQSAAFEGKDQYLHRLEQAKNEIERIQREIEAIQTAIRENLYQPQDDADQENRLQWLGLGQRGMVHDLYNRYYALSEYDRGLIDSADTEALMKCKTQVDTLFNTLMIGIGCAAVVAFVAVWLVLRVRKRKKTAQQEEMQESDE